MSQDVWGLIDVELSKTTPPLTGAKGAFGSVWDDIERELATTMPVRLSPEQDRLALGQSALEASARASALAPLAPRPFQPGTLPDAPVTTVERLQRLQQAPAKLALEAGRGFTAGTVGAVQGTSAALASRTYPTAAAEIQGAAGEGRRMFGAPTDSLRDPGTVAHTAGQVAGSIALLAGGAGAARTAGAGIAGAIASRGLPPLAAAAGGAVAGRAALATPEALQEAAQVWNTVFTQTKDQGAADTAALKVFGGNLALLGATSGPLLERVRSVAGVGLRAAAEGGQEGAQQVLGNVATGRPTLEGVPQAATIGAIAAPIAGGLIDAATRARQSVPPPRVQISPPPDAPSAARAIAPVRPAPGFTQYAAKDAEAQQQAAAPQQPPTSPPPVDSRVDALVEQLNIAPDEAQRMLARLDAETSQPRPVPAAPPSAPPVAPPSLSRPASPGQQPGETGPAVVEGTDTPAAPDTRAQPRAPQTSPTRALAEDAVAHGFPGTAEEADAAITARARELYAAMHGEDVQRTSPTALLRAVAERGGLTVSRDLEEGGELAWLREFRDPRAVNTLGGVPNVLRRPTRHTDGTVVTGRVPEEMAELLRQAPEFAHLQSGHDLIEALAQAARDVRDVRGRDAFDVAYYARGAGVEPGRRWWEPGPTLTADDIVGPADDLPDWAQDSDPIEADEPGVLGEGGAGRAPAPRRGLPPLRPDLRADRGMPADFERSGSPTRRPFFEQPDPSLADRFKGAKPISEQQAVEQLRDIFAEPADTGSPLGATTRRLPVRMKKVAAGAFGHYEVTPRLIRLKRDFDLSTFTHELGHHIDFSLFARNASQPVGLFARELDDLGAATSPARASRKYRQAEGVAEYFRIWMVSPEQAGQRAPAFTQAVQDVIAKHPDFGRQLEAGRAVVQQYASQSLETRGKARISVSPREPRRQVRQVLEQAYDRMIDDLAPLRRAVEDLAAEKGKAPGAAANAYVLARNAAGATGKAQGFVQGGVRGRNGRFLSGSLEDALAPVVHRLVPSESTRDQAPDFSSYLVALRVREVRATKRDAGMTVPEANAIIAAVERDPERAAFEAARDQVYAYQNALLAYGREYGAFNDQQLTAIKRLAEHYVPLQRVRDEAADALTPATSNKIANRNSPIKRLTGSGRDIIDPIESIVRNTAAMVDMVEKNRAMQALTAQAAGAPGGAKWLVKVSPNQQAVKFNLASVTGHLKRALDDAGLDVSTGQTGRGSPALFVGDEVVDLDQLVTLFQPVAWGSPKDRIVTVIKNGERQFWQVQDEALYEALTVIGARPTSEVLKWTEKPVQTLRAGVILAPAFAIRNVMRDTVGAMIQSRYGFIPVWDSARGAVSMLRKDEDYRQFMASGVQSAAKVDIKRARLREEINRITRKRGAASATVHYARHPIEALRAFSEAFETSTRLGEFKLAKEAAGVERRGGVVGIAQRLADRGPKNDQWSESLLTTASLAAADVTVDFRRGGRLSKEMSKWSAFFNARVQGYARMAETARRDPVATALTAGTLAALSAALWAINKDDEEYQELSPQVKRDYWVLRTGDRAWVFIPKPHEWAVPGNVAEAFLEWATRNDPQAMRDLIPEAPKTVLMTLAGTAILPWIEAAFNWDAYRERPIVSPWKANLDPALQDNEWTTDTARAVGSAVNVSPAKIEHVIRQTGGTLASEALQALDLVTTPLTNPDRPSRPEKRVEQLPVVGGTLRSPAPSARSQSLIRWRELRDDYETAKASVAELASRGDTAGAQARIERALKDLGVSEADRPAILRASKAAADRSTRDLAVAFRIPRMEQAQKRMSTLNQERAAIEGSRTLSPAQKREALDRLFAEMTTLARTAVHGSTADVLRAATVRRVPIPLKPAFRLPPAKEAAGAGPRR